MKTMNASNARKAFAQVLAAVESGNEPVIIVRYNQPIAALVPIGRLLPAERDTLKRKLRLQNGTARAR
jgi:prevent-host-death family protein